MRANPEGGLAVKARLDKEKVIVRAARGGQRHPSREQPPRYPSSSLSQPAPVDSNLASKSTSMGDSPKLSPKVQTIKDEVVKSPNIRMIDDGPIRKTGVTVVE